MNLKRKNYLHITLAAFMFSCSSNMPVEFKISYSRDNLFYAGASRVNITPIPYNEDGTCPGGAFCFEVPVQKGPEDGCPENIDRIYEGYINDPDGDPSDPCLEGFIDANRNGYFDAIWLGGFNMARPATGVDWEAPLYARILALKFNEEFLLLVVFDNIGFPTIQLAGLREKLEGLSGGTLKKKSIILLSVHNHESPDTQGLWGPDLVSNYPIQIVEGLSLRDLLRLPFLEDVNVQFPTKGFVPQYWRWVEENLIKGVKEAISRMEPVLIKYFEIEVPHIENGCHRIPFEGEVKIDCDGNLKFNENRDKEIYEDGLRTGGYAGCFTDPALPVRYLITDGRFPYVVDYNVYGYQFVKKEKIEEAVSTFIVWGNHVEVMSDDNTALSGDWAGYMCNEIEKKYKGTCLFQIAPEGGLTTPLGTCIPFINENNEYVQRDGSPAPHPTSRPDNFIELFHEKNYPLKPAVSEIERAKSLGKQMAKTISYALSITSTFTPVSLKNRVSFVNLPLHNPLFYVGGRLDLLDGFSLLLREDLSPEKIDDIIWKKELSPGNISCGPVLCIRVPVNLVEIELKDDGNILKTGFITNPGEFFPEYVVGRKYSQFYFSDAPESLSKVSLDPDFPSRYTRDINPQKFDEIPGIRDVAKKMGYSLFFVLAESNSSLGYEMPWSDFILVYEGVFSEIKDYAHLIDFILDRNDNNPDENIALYHFFKLSETDLYLTFEKLMNDVWKYYSIEVNDYNPPSGEKVFLANHPNIYEEEVSVGPYVGDILYNMLRSMIEGRDYYPFRKLPESDPNMDEEIKNLPKLKME